MCGCAGNMRVEGGGAYGQGQKTSIFRDPHILLMGSKIIRGDDVFYRDAPPSPQLTSNTSSIGWVERSLRRRGVRSGRVGVCKPVIGWNPVRSRAASKGSLSLTGRSALVLSGSRGSEEEGEIRSAQARASVKVPGIFLERVKG